MKRCARVWLRCVHERWRVPIGDAGPGVAVDNDGPRHDVWLGPFEIAPPAVTNGEYPGCRQEDPMQAIWNGVKVEP